MWGGSQRGLVHFRANAGTNMEKIMRMHLVTGTIENGFVHFPEKSEWLAKYLQEMETFPKGRYDGRVDSTFQPLDWFKNNSMSQTLGLIDYWKKEIQNRAFENDFDREFTVVIRLSRLRD
jgi:hypothetical protein